MLAVLHLIFKHCQIHFFLFLVWLLLSHNLSAPVLWASPLWVTCFQSFYKPSPHFCSTTINAPTLEEVQSLPLAIHYYNLLDNIECFLIFPLYFESLELKTFSFNSNDFIKILHELFRNYRHFYTQSPIFRGTALYTSQFILLLP